MEIVKNIVGALATIIANAVGAWVTIWYDCKEDECGNDCSNCGCDTQEDGCPGFHGYDDCPMGA